VSPKLGVDTLQDFIALAKAKPGTLNFGSSGVGNSIHLAVEQFNAAVGIKAVHVPFKTGNETDTAMIAGEVQYTIASLATSLPLIQAGRIKALAVTGEGRDPALPNVPNLSESGLPVRIPDQLFGMVGPANMPAPVTSKLLEGRRGHAGRSRVPGVRAPHRRRAFAGAWRGLPQPGAERQPDMGRSHQATRHHAQQLRRPHAREEDGADRWRERHRGARHCRAPGR